MKEKHIIKTGFLSLMTLYCTIHHKTSEELAGYYSHCFTHGCTELKLDANKNVQYTLEHPLGKGIFSGTYFLKSDTLILKLSKPYKYKKGSYKINTLLKGTEKNTKIKVIDLDGIKMPGIQIFLNNRKEALFTDTTGEIEINETITQIKLKDVTFKDTIDLPLSIFSDNNYIEIKIYADELEPIIYDLLVDKWIINNNGLQPIPSHKNEISKQIFKKSKSSIF